MTRPYTDVRPYLELPVRLSPTRVELSARCHRRHVLSDLLHLSGGVSAAAAFGDVMHQARAAFWRLGETDRVVGYEAMMRAIQTAWSVMPSDKGYHTQELALSLAEHYAKHARLAGDLPGDWHLVELEQHRTALVGDLELGYTVDALIESSDGQLAFVDLKTSSGLSPKWRAAHQSSIQMRLYKRLEEERLGRTIDYVVIEGFDKKRSELEYLIADLTWTSEYVEEAYDLALSLAERDAAFLRALEEDADADRYYEALELALTCPELVAFNLQDCYSYYFKCPFYELCHGCPTDRVGLAQATLETLVYDY